MGNLLAELRRRKVFRVAALYATFALLLLVVGFQMGELFWGRGRRRERVSRTGLSGFATAFTAM